MRVMQTDFMGDDNLGIFASSSENMSLVGTNVTKNNLKRIGDILETDVIRLLVAGSDFIGIFCSLNSNGILLPNIARKEEIEIVRKAAKKHDMSVSIVDSKFTAIGNTVLCNNKGAALSKLLSSTDKKTIEDCLGVEVDYCTLAELDNIGSSGVATDEGCLVHRDSSEDEIKKVEEILHVDCDIGTANFGSPFVGSCCIANNKGAVMGRSTTGPEVVRIMDALKLV